MHPKVSLFYIIFSFFLLGIVSASDRYEEEFPGYDLEVFREADSLFSTFSFEETINIIDKIEENKELSPHQYIYAKILVAKCLKELYSFKMSFELLNEVEDLFPEILDSVSSLSAMFHMEFGIAFQKLDSFDIAEEELIKSLQINQSILGPNHNKIGVNYHYLGELYFYKLRDYKRANFYFEKAFRFFSKTSFSDRHLKSKAYYNIAAIYYIRDEFNQALSNIKVALKVENLSSYSDKNHLCNIYNFTSTLYSQLGQDSLALMFAEIGLEQRISSDNLNIKQLYDEKYKLAMRYFENEVV